MDLKRFWPTVLIVLTTVLAQFDAPIQAFVAGHPTLSMIAGSVAVLVANLVKSPKAG